MDGYTLFIKPTKNCNLDCVYCDLTAKEEGMSLETASDITDFVKNSKEEFTRILFTGGEPLLNYKVIEHFSKEFPDVDLKIITNGTILNDGIKKFFEANKDRLSIILSMDGPKEIQDKHRSNSYDDVMENLEFFKPYIARVNIVVTPESIFKLHTIINFIRDNIYHGYDILIQNGIDWDKSIDFKKFKEYFLENCLNYPTLKEMLSVEEHGLCECGDHLMIDQSGDIYPCMNYNTEYNKMGDIYNGIDENKRKPYKLARERMEEPFVCLLNNREETGSIFKETKIHPGFFEKYLDLVRRIKDE